MKQNEPDRRTKDMKTIENMPMEGICENQLAMLVNVVCMKLVGWYNFELSSNEEALGCLVM